MPQSNLSPHIATSLLSTLVLAWIQVFNYMHFTALPPLSPSALVTLLPLVLWAWSEHSSPLLADS